MCEDIAFFFDSETNHALTFAARAADASIPKGGGSQPWKGAELGDGGRWSRAW